MMKRLLIDITANLCATLILILFFICCTPYLILTYIIDAYKEDRAVLHMHREIECFLSKERDENEYWQMNAW